MFGFLIKAFAALTIVSMVGSTFYRAVISPAFGAALPVESYASCEELRQDYPTGLAATQEAADAVTTDPAQAPRVVPQAYVLNMDLDRKQRGRMCIKG